MPVTAAKNMFASKTVLGALAVILAQAFGWLGFEVGTEEITSLLVHITSTVGSIVCLWGRFTTNSKIKCPDSLRAIVPNSLGRIFRGSGPTAMILLLLLAPGCAVKNMPGPEQTSMIIRASSALLNKLQGQYECRQPPAPCVKDKSCHD